MPSIRQALRALVAKYEAALSEQFPSLLDPLIRERDVFLSLTLKVRTSYLLPLPHLNLGPPSYFLLTSY